MISPIFIGSSINWHSSLFNRLVINELTFSTGGKLFFNNQDDAIGVTVHQFGIRLKNNKTVYILPAIVVSGSKKLSYLPAIIYTDLLLSNTMKKNEIFLGSRIKINKNLKFQIGTSTRKIDQNISQSIIKSIFGSTGFGFMLQSGKILIQYGIYLYGNGFQIQGLDISVNF